MDCSPPGSSDHGILLARILEWIAISSSSSSSWPRVWALIFYISCIKLDLTHSLPFWILILYLTCFLSLKFLLLPSFSVSFFFLIYFNWRIIILQYCSSFCHTLSVSFISILSFLTRFLTFSWESPNYPNFKMVIFLAFSLQSSYFHFSHFQNSHLISSLKTKHNFSFFPVYQNNVALLFKKRKLLS